MTKTATKFTADNLHGLLDKGPATASAPCRIDFGGTLDIASFHYPLRQMAPATVNIALDLRTTVTLKRNDEEGIRISSKGFPDAVFPPAKAPYRHPLGLMFAVADYFGANGVHIDIHSASPPRSGLGGSSVAAVALIAAFCKILESNDVKKMDRGNIALLAHYIEQAVAGVPCGLQDQLAAVFGGVNRWDWPADPQRPPFIQRPLFQKEALARLDSHLLVAYLGVTHESKDVNSNWIRQFIDGKSRENWHEIVRLTHEFADTLGSWDIAAAVDAMRRETAIRKAMTPDVLGDVGDWLVAAAVTAGCGARFTGAGGGGCLWAIGQIDDIALLKTAWERILDEQPTARLLDCRVDSKGVI